MAGNEVRTRVPATSRRSEIMVRRRRRQKSSPGLLVAVAVLVLVAVTIIQQLAAHPAVAAALLVLIVGAMVIGGIISWQRRKQRLIEARQQWDIQVARSREIGHYHAMAPKEFEHALAFLCARDGCTGVKVVGGAGDLGADVVAMAPDGRRIVLQAKRYGPTTKVGGPDLQRFGGTCFTVHGAHVAAVVTTSSYTKQAREYAAHMRIHLFDQTGLAAWASRTGPAPWH